MSSQDFIQIVHVDANHWVCISNINCPPNTCNVYDSMSPKYSMTLMTQVAAIMKCSEDCFTMRHIEVQIQHGSSDCGLFAIAFTTLLCERKIHQSIHYNKTR